ncbi:MAG TPA: hypothetical protein VGL13_06810 [Polyangiaceae bacterium]
MIVLGVALGTGDDGGAAFDDFDLSGLCTPLLSPTDVDDLTVLASRVAEEHQVAEREQLRRQREDGDEQRPKRQTTNCR